MKCHICAARYRQTSGIFQCPQCQHVHRKYAGDNIQYHRDSYRKQKAHHRAKKEFDKGAVTPVFHAARKNICERRMEVVQPLVQPQSSCLDVGAGAGTFANMLQPLVKRIDCTELSPPLIAECQRLGFRTYTTDFLGMPNDWGQYDIAFAWHVLEHVEDAYGFVRKMIGFTNRYCIIEVPCNRKIRKAYDGHVHHFCRNSLKILLENCGLHIINMTDGIQSPAILAITERRENSH